MKNNNRLHTAGQSRNVPKLMVLLCGLEKELWHAEHDEWGNVLREDNPHNLQQLIHLPGQQYDDENPDCTTIATGTTIRDRDGISPKIR